MGNPVKAFRESLGLSRKDMAKRMGIAYTTLHFIEDGYYSHLTSGMVGKLVELGAPDDISDQYTHWRSDSASQNQKP